ncbi:hypothetical protein KGMB02408_09280 [Bacteroides faecalis]|uniref:Uncharacterized protein n=1 Tax=Bacteroides faecalis TaxID=2447885 RepID=A0A401LR99_9BACE|nr:hypothetical protein KGMB02408_09280 [Bacteroides faecalis]
MFRTGWNRNQKSVDAFPLLEAGANPRTAEVSGIASATFLWAPVTKEDTSSKEMEEAWEYYRTSRTQFCIAPSVATVGSFIQLVTYDAFHTQVDKVELYVFDKEGKYLFKQTKEGKVLATGVRDSYDITSLISDVSDIADLRLQFLWLYVLM